MEIRVLVKQNEKAELEKFIKTCEDAGMKLSHRGGGKLPNWNGYFAVLTGEKWVNPDTKQCEHEFVSSVAYKGAKICSKCDTIK